MCIYVNFNDLHASVQSLLSEGEKYADRLDWYDPEVQHFVDFQKELDLWIDNKSSSNSKLCTSTDLAQAQWGNRGAARSNDEMWDLKVYESTSSSAHAQAIAEAES